MPDLENIQRIHLEVWLIEVKMANPRCTEETLQFERLLPCASLTLNV